MTDIAIRALSLPLKGQKDFWDDSLKGFGVRVSQGGAKTFVVLMSGNRKSLGRYPLVSLADARKTARQLLAQQELGRTVTPRKFNALLPPKTFADAVEHYLVSHVRANNKPGTAREAERIIRKHFPFGLRPLDTITSAEVMQIVDALSSRKRPSAANHVFAQARSFFRWCVRRGYVDRNPLEALTPPNKRQSRDRVLSDGELRHVWLAAQSFPFPFGHIVALLILTGQRLGEISALRWDYINTENRLMTLPKSIVKNNSEHTFPYGAITQQVVDSISKHYAFLFPSRQRTSFFDGHNRAKTNFDKACPLPHWTLHDLRRTFATIHARIGTPPHVTEALLNHKTGTRTPMQRIYDRHTYIPEMRAAMENYERYLTTLFQPE